MNICKNGECNKKLKGSQKKFCSQSCAAKINNLGVRRHGKPPTKCLTCNKKTSSHERTFCSIECHQIYKYNEGIECWKKTGKFPGRITIKHYLLNKQSNKCDICDIINLWENKELIFVLDHIDGNSDNNLEENLRLLCPNCDSQTPTFKNRNLGSGRHYRRIRYAEEKSF